MSKIQDFYIEFQKKWAIYDPGETVTGKTVINLVDSLVCDAVQVMLYGSARVLWTERKVVNNRFQTVNNHQERVYFNDSKTLWKYNYEDAAKQPQRRQPGVLSVMSDASGRLSKGKHSFNFTFQLPSDIPTSFESSKVPGYVRYFAKVMLITEGTARISRKLHFCVCNPLDLNRCFPETGLPCKRSTSLLFKKTGLRGPSGPVSISAAIFKTGFVPGEPVPIEIDIKNGSSKTVKSVRGAIRMKAICYATSPSYELKEVSQIITENRLTVPTRSGTDQTICCLLYVPAISPTLRETDIIETKYELVIQVLCSSKLYPVEVVMPIVIGTVPITPGSIPGETWNARMPNGGTCVEQLDPNLPPLPSYMDLTMLPPPSYEDSVMGAFQENSENNANITRATGKEDDFLPKYSFYAFPPQ